MKLTEHSKLRLRQRAGVRSSEKNKLFRQALLKGIRRDIILLIRIMMRKK